MIFSPSQLILAVGAAHVALGRFRRRRNDTLRLEQFARESLPGESGDNARWTEALPPAFAALGRRTELRGPVALVLPPHLVLMKFIKAPRTDDAKLTKVVHFEAEHGIPFALADVVWDFAVSGESAHSLEIMLCAVKREIVEAICSAAESAGFPPQRVLPPVIALQAAHERATPGPQPGAALLVDLGARSTTLLFASSHRCVARTVALGGQNLIEEICRLDGCDRTTAETRLLAHERCPSIAKALEWFVTRLSREITRTHVHFARDPTTNLPERVWLAGGPSAQPGLAALLVERVQRPVARLTFDRILESGDARTPQGNSGASQSCQEAVLVGAAALACRRGQTRPDLLPPQWRARERLRLRFPWFAATAFCATVALLPLVNVQRDWNDALTARIAALDAGLASLRAHDQRERADLARLESIRRQIAMFEEMHARRSAWSQLLADLQERLALVDDVWLDALHVLPPSRENSAPPRIAISGRMLDRANPLATVSPEIFRRATELLGHFAGSPRVAKIEGERFDNRQPGILRFSLELVLQPDARQ